jgi:hypothetical protein
VSYDPVQIASGLTSGKNYLSVVRDLDNYFYAAYYDPEQTPKVTRVKYSDDEGQTWYDEDFSQSVGSDIANADGGDDPQLMCDSRGNLWMGMSSFDGNTKPTILFRDVNELNWGGMGRGGVHVLSLDTSVSNFVCKLDSFHRYGGGYGWDNMCGAWIKSGAIRYADLFTGLTTQTVDNTGTPAEPRLAVTSAGQRWIAFRDGTTAYMRSLDGRSGSWSARVQVSQAGETVLSVEDIAIHPTKDTPSVIYRISDGGKQKLMLAEYNVSNLWPSYFDYERVWNGTNEEDFYTGCKLAYDERESVFVYSLNNRDSLGKPENCQFTKLRAHAWTSWTMMYYTSGALGSIPEQVAFYDLHPNVNNTRINVPYQGALAFSWLWVDAAPTGSERFYWINFDRHDNAQGAYPTIFTRVTGDQPYREDPQNITSGASVVFAGEGTASGTFPGIKAQQTYREQKVFKTSRFRTEGNYTARISIAPNGRRLLDIEFVALTAAQLSTLETFLRPRQRTKVPFSYAYPPDYATDDMIPVRVLGRHLRPRLINKGVWALRFQLLEAK